MSEIWSAISGFEGIYEVSNMGQVRSLDRMIRSRWGTPRHKQGGIRKSRVGKTGYRYMILYKDGANETRKIHRLVASAFCRRPSGCDYVNHKDGDKLNNHAENLEWVTASQNAAHAIELGLYVPTKGEDKSPSGLRNKDIDAIRRRILEMEPIQSIANDFNISRSVVMGIKTCRSWGDVGCPHLSKKCRDSSFRGANHPKRKLSDDQVFEIIDLLGSGLSMRKIASRYGVHETSIGSINSGRAYSRIRPSDGRTPPYNR